MLIANQNLIRGQTTGGPHREGAADNCLVLQSDPSVPQTVIIHSPAGRSRSSKENLGAAGHVVVTLFFQ